MTKTIAETFDDHWKAAPGPLNTPCHIWQRRTSMGYGKAGNEWAHRLSWVRAHGSIGDGLCVLHRCDVPACVNPDHLFIGTKGDNIRDAAAKGRTCKGRKHWTRRASERIARGERHGSARLNETDIERVRDMRAGGCTQQQIADWLFVSRSLISLILGGKYWTHV